MLTLKNVCYNSNLHLDGLLSNEAENFMGQTCGVCDNIDAKYGRGKCTNVGNDCERSDFRPLISPDTPYGS